ncbi:MAG: phosphoenolpyruvate synthase [Sebaldella sp.]|nr:phosphoenolpyruvate synthase [Sebaldella sp.]
MKYILYFNEIGKKDLPLVGGKGANLGELFNNGFLVPAGFCVTTDAFKLITKNEEINNLIKKLDNLKNNNIEDVELIGKEIRDKIKELKVSEAVKIAVYGALNNSGANDFYAVRSSATAEDLLGTSFAGQQDTYLNISGYENLMVAIQSCWASLFTDRAIIYRIKNGFTHEHVELSVIIQKMIFSEVSGIMFTADPITGNREILNIDASFGLGEALVSGLVTPDFYQVYNSEIINKQISQKDIGIFPEKIGGIIKKNIEDNEKNKQVLTEREILELTETGVNVQKVFGNPQDIEWALYQGKFYILQSRPITSLYPIPLIKDSEKHVFFSFGHVQMMTNAMKPLALSIFETVKIFDKPNSKEYTRLLYDAGGRMFIDISYFLGIEKIRGKISSVIKYVDEQASFAVQELVDRGEIFANDEKFQKKLFKFIAPILRKIGLNIYLKNSDKTKIRAKKFFDTMYVKWEKEINSLNGTERLEKIRLYISRMINFLLSNGVQYPASGIVALSKIKKICAECFDESKVQELLANLNISLENNVTSEMMMEIYDIAELVRDNKELISALKETNNENFWSDIEKIPNSSQFIEKMKEFMIKYGMRCAGEIDITRKRWVETPKELVPFIMSHIQTSKTNEHHEKFEEGKVTAKNTEKEIIEAVKAKLGKGKAKKVEKLIKVYRNLMGFRESPKYFIVKFFGLVRGIILEEAYEMEKQNVLPNKEDVFYFSLDEIIEIATGSYKKNIKETLIERKEDFKIYEKLTPPRVMTSNGEIITGKIKNSKAPEGTLTGTAASSGIVEGIARVVLTVSEADLKSGEIMIAPFTDPAWTPLFNSVSGLVIEVGGMMTHGSVIAREYGIPAVVGVNNATKIIKTGDKIRVNGTEGYVEIL